jgi:ectoine hydroxylase-related dioxygenase (phytanoyl-CoA dioxygenase family)
MSPTLSDLSEPAPPPGPADWNDDGVQIYRKLIPDDLIKAYEEEWISACGGPAFGFGTGRAEWTVRDAAGAACLTDTGPEILTLEAAEPGGWPDCTPYMRHPALRRICTHPAIAAALEALLGEPAGVHLNLTGWVSTERDWHQDGYLNPPEVGDYYAAVWVALGDIHLDSGPFQYIPGSHRWHRLLRERFEPHLDLGDPQWPKHSEDILSPLVDDVVQNDRCPGCLPGSGVATINCEACLGEGCWPHEVISYTPSKGDVLFWHPRLYHRGSRANVPGAYRPALIAHYSGIYHHSAMPPAVQNLEIGVGPDEAGWLFPLASSGPVR